MTLKFQTMLYTKKSKDFKDKKEYDVKNKKHTRLSTKNLNIARF